MLDAARDNVATPLKIWMDPDGFGSDDSGSVCCGLSLTHMSKDAMLLLSLHQLPLRKAASNYLRRR